jgi:hypothetical protein
VVAGPVGRESRGRAVLARRGVARAPELQQFGPPAPRLVERQQRVDERVAQLLPSIVVAVQRVGGAVFGVARERNPRGMMYAIGALWRDETRRGGELIAVATAGTPTGRWGPGECPVGPEAAEYR